MRFIISSVLVILFAGTSLYGADDPDLSQLVQKLAGLKVEGKGYFYYHHDASEGDGQSNSFDFSRMYIGARYKLSDEFTVRYLTDFSHQDKTGKFEVFSKYAYVDWKIRDNLNILMGLQGTHNWKQPESAWGYRSIQYSPMDSFGKYWGEWAKAYTSYLEKWVQDPATSAVDTLELTYRHANFSATSRYNMGASADLGVSVKYEPSDAAYVNFMALNGSGYKHAEDDMYKNFQLRSGVFLVDKTVHISGYLGLEPWMSVDEKGSSKSYTNIQWDVMTSYTAKEKFTVVVNVNLKTFAGIEKINALCFSVFGHGYLVPKKLKALARYDIYDSGFNDVEVKAGDDKFESNGGLVIVGFDYKAHKKISIIPNFQILSFEDSEKDPVNSVYVHLNFEL